MESWYQSEGVKPYISLLSRVLITTFILIVIVRMGPAVFTFFMPFIWAFIAASAMNPLISLLQRKWKIKRGILSIFMVILVLLIMLAIIGGLLFALVREVIQIAQNIDNVLAHFNNTLEALAYNLYWLLNLIPADAEEMMAGLMDGFVLWVTTQGTVFADAVVANTVAITINIGGGVVSFVIFVMSSYFMMTDYPRISERLSKLLGRKNNEGYSTLKNVTLSALGGYMKAQTLMAFSIFLLTLAFLLLIRQESALLLAFLFGILDFLPIVGTSIVLVPWGIINLLGGDYFRGFYLLGMSLTAFLVRRMIEPKIVGDQMGLSPLMALLSIYVGMQLGGVVGLILGPIVAMVLVNLYKAGVFDGWINDIKAVVEDIRKRFNKV